MQSYFVCIPFFFMITAELRSMKAKVLLIWKKNWLSNGNYGMYDHYARKRMYFLPEKTQKY